MLDLKHVSSKYQVMNGMPSFNAERKFLSLTQNKSGKNASKILSHVLK
jgi:hypothetical protein